MKIDHRCRWVRRRLPLLAGGELGVEERRKAERHLIGCPGCQARRGASTEALSALRVLAEVGPAGLDSPSLWPALLTQIRQSRHAPPRPPWWSTSSTRPWLAFGLAMGCGVLMASAMARPPKSEGSLQAQAPAIAAEPESAGPSPVLAYSPRGALPEAPASPSGALPGGGDGPAGPPSGLLFNYDLDHMIPMGPSNRDPQHSY